MKIVMSGATSFSGAMIASALVKKGGSLHALARKKPDELNAQIQRRISIIPQSVNWTFGVGHGSSAYVEAIEASQAETYVIHAHPMDGYKTRDYDLAGVLNQMVKNLRLELIAFKKGGGQRVVYSGSVFEPNSQLASNPNQAASLYGISKTIVWEALRMDCNHVGLKLDKVTIPNPFGPGEYNRLGNYLASTWKSGSTPIIQSPDYIRDNIPVQELANRYSNFIIDPSQGNNHLRPSGYISSQLDFAKRMAFEFSKRLNNDLQVDWSIQKDFSEPTILVNDGSKSDSFESNVEKYWDEYFAYYFGDT